MVLAVTAADRLKALEQENARLKKLLADTILDKEAWNLHCEKTMYSTALRVPGNAI